MTLTIVVCSLTFLALALCIMFLPSVKIGKITVDTYWIIALSGALLLLGLKQLPIKEAYKGLTAPSEVNPIKILILFFAMTFLSVFLDEAGFFGYLAKRAAAKAKTSQFSLFCIFYFLIAFLTVVTSNDIVILTFTPFICFFCKNANVDATPYLVGEFAAANTWSMALIIGNPTNIYLATSASIKFTEYLSVMILPTLFAGAVEFLIIVLLFKKRLKAKISPSDGEAKIEDKTCLIVGLIHISVCLIFLVISEFIGVEMWLVSAACAVSLTLIIIIASFSDKTKAKKLINSFKRLPYQLIPFVLSMFIIVICLGYRGVSAMIGDALASGNVIYTYGISSFLSANVINNIPMSILFCSLPISLGEALYKRAIFATVIGSNIGAFLTPVGALAGIMFTGIAKKYDVKYGFKEFLRYGIVIGIPTLFSALMILSAII